MIDTNRPQDPVISVALKVSDWMTIGRGLEEVPFKLAAPLIGSINQQINAALNPAPPPPAPPAADTPPNATQEPAASPATAE